MAANRRTPSRGQRPRGNAGPGRPVAARTSPRPAAGSQRPERPRLTGRAAILVLVLAVLAVSWASSFRAYFQQRQDIAELRAEIQQTGEDIDYLEREKRRWHDDEYVRQQARLRFGYTLPGERLYQTLDENGRPLDSPDVLSDPADLPQGDPTAWWDAAWESVEAAGNPEEHEQAGPPVGTIEAPAQDSAE